MTYCAVCGHHVEPVAQPAVLGWVHACRCKAQHRHLITHVISERQRDERFAQREEEAIEA